MGSQSQMDLAGLTLVVDGIRVGATTPGTTGTELTGSEITLIDGITAGTVTASKAVVVDSNKDASAFRTVGVVNLDAGSSGAAGTVDVFPTTASKGKIAITATDSTGNTTTTITNAAQAGAVTYTIPDAGASANFVMSEGAATVNGAKTFGTMPVIPSATVAAAGSLQADATAMTTGFTLVSGADATKGVKLPTAAAGLVCIVKNNAAAALKVYPFSGDAINAIAADSAISLGNNTSAVFVAYDATTWYTVPLLPS